MKTNSDDNVKKLFPSLFFPESQTPILGRKQQKDNPGIGPVCGIDEHAKAVQHEGLYNQDENDSYWLFIRKNTKLFLEINDVSEIIEDPTDSILEKVDKYNFLIDLKYSVIENKIAYQIAEMMINNFIDNKTFFHFSHYMKNAVEKGFNPAKNEDVVQELICIYNIIQFTAIEEEVSDSFDIINIEEVIKNHTIKSTNKKTKQTKKSTSPVKESKSKTNKNKKQDRIKKSKLHKKGKKTRKRNKTKKISQYYLCDTARSTR